MLSKINFFFRSAIATRTKTIGNILVKIAKTNAIDALPFQSVERKIQSNPRAIKFICPIPKVNLNGNEITNKNCINTKSRLDKSNNFFKIIIPTVEKKREMSKKIFAAIDKGMNSNGSNKRYNGGG